MTKQFPSRVTMVRPPAQLKEKKSDPAAVGVGVGWWKRVGKSVANKWTSSLLKLCYRELLVFLISFKSISCIHRYVLDNQQQLAFEKWVGFFDRYTKMISLPFLLGFYLTIVAARWWQQHLAVPWPDRLMMTMTMYVGKPKESGSRSLRRVLMRRCLLMIVLLFRQISDTVHDRFPRFQDLVQYGLMTGTEKEHLESIVSDVNLFWVPGSWFVSTLQEAVDDGTLSVDPIGIKLVMEEFLHLRANCGLLWGYYSTRLPKVYGQVVKMAVYSFFAVSLVGRQCVEIASSTVVECFVDSSLPIWTALEFFFYMGLLKAAEQMVCPFGDDDEDFDLNFLIDRHVKAVHLNVDWLDGHYPPLEETTTPLASPVHSSSPIFRITKH